MSLPTTNTSVELQQLRSRVAEQALIIEQQQRELNTMRRHVAQRSGTNQTSDSAVKSILRHNGTLASTLGSTSQQRRFTGVVTIDTFESPVDGQLIYIDQGRMRIELHLQQSGTTGTDNVPVYYIRSKIDPSECTLYQKRPAMKFRVVNDGVVVVRQNQVAGTASTILHKIVVTSIENDDTLMAPIMFPLTVTSTWSLPANLSNDQPRITSFNISAQ